MSITFTRDGKQYQLAMDGTVKRDGTMFGNWTTDDDNALQITPGDGSAILRQSAAWSTERNRLSVKPDGGNKVEFIDETDGHLQFRLKNNCLIVDPLPDDDFSFGLSGDWSVADDFSALRLKAATADLAFTGGLNDSQSRFAWTFDATSGGFPKRFVLRFEGVWRMTKRPKGEAGVLAVFAFEYNLGGQTTKDQFEMPVEVTADSANGNRLLFSYKREGDSTRWGVAFAGRFTSKGGSIIGYSAEVYDEAGKISSRFTFDFKGKLQDGSAATRNALKFVLTISGQAVEVSLQGTFNFSKASISFAFKLNTSSKTGEISTISLSVQFVSAKGNTASIDVLVDGSVVTITVKVGFDVTFGGSRKGSVYGRLDTKIDGDTVGVEGMFGITFN